LADAINNLFNDAYAVDLEFVNVDDINALIDSVIKANNNLNESLESNNFEMIGKDVSSLQALINQLETARKNELEEEKENNTNTVLENTVKDQNTVNQNVLNQVNN